MDVGQWEVWEWDICMYLNAMNKTGKFTRSHTNAAECSATQESIKCPRRGRCLIAKMRVSRTADQARGDR